VQGAYQPSPFLGVLLILVVLFEFVLIFFLSLLDLFAQALRADIITITIWLSNDMASEVIRRGPLNNGDAFPSSEIINFQALSLRPSYQHLPFGTSCLATFHKSTQERIQEMIYN